MAQTVELWQANEPPAVLCLYYCSSYHEMLYFLTWKAEHPVLKLQRTETRLQLLAKYRNTCPENQALEQSLLYQASSRFPKQQPELRIISM